MSQAWYVSRNGQQSGPFTWEELYGHLQAGSISQADLVWTEGMPQWTPISQIQGLSSAMAWQGSGQKPGKGRYIALASLVVSIIVLGFVLVNTLSSGDDAPAASLPETETEQVMDEEARVSTQAPVPLEEPPPPEGCRIAYSKRLSLDAELILIDPDGSNKVNLSEISGIRMTSNGVATWSPKGSMLVFEAHGDDSRERALYRINADGTGAEMLVEHAEFDNYDQLYDPAWSPDGSRIAYTARGLILDDGLHLINADGGGKTQLTDDGNHLGATWSPDGTKIAFEAFREIDAGITQDIYTVTLADGSITRLTNTDKSLSQPSWSPCGQFIVVTEEVDSGYHGPLYIMNADGGNLRQLTPDGVNGGYAAWSPGGTKIAFERSEAYNVYDIYMIDPDGSNMTPLTSDGTSRKPSWAPYCYY